MASDELIHLIEAQAGVDRELVGHLPLVLDIDSHQHAQFRDVVGDRHRRAVVGAVADHAGLDQRRIADECLLAADREAGAERMRRIELIGAVALDAVGVGSAGDIRGDAVQQEIAGRVRQEVQIVVAGEIGQLSVEAVDRISAPTARQSE